MKINKLKNEVFYDFASSVAGVKIEFYMADLEIFKTNKGVKLKFFLGGEIEDERKFIFQDTKCLYINNAHGLKKDVSFVWVHYLLKNVKELSEDEKIQIVEEYNNNLENEIKNFTSQKRDELIKL